MEDLALHILDIVENSIAAGAARVRIAIRESRRDELLLIEIADDGRGMNEGVARRAADPFFTTRTTRRVGLGLPLLEQAATAAGGGLTIESAKERGTTVTARFQHSHPDRQPLGDIVNTLMMLFVGNPQVEFEYVHQDDDSEVAVSTGEIKAGLEGAPICSPEGISAVRKSLEKLRQHAGAKP